MASISRSLIQKYCPQLAHAKSLPVRFNSTMANLTPAERIEDFKNRVYARNSHQSEFLQAFDEVYTSVTPLLHKDLNYLNAFECIVEPERCISFRVTWLDDQGNLQVNRGYRVQYSSAVGPYKGGLRFHPSVTMSVIKFLGFEQIFKNSLTGLAMGGGKGGSDFDPKGKSDQEILRFCQSFMTELFRHIGPAVDVPAGDIGVGGREIGYMFGQYKRLASRFEGALTGKDINWGGSQIRPEATGYGCVYFVEQLYKSLKNESSLAGKTCVVSGCGNVAMYCLEKLVQLGAKVVTLSDSSGYLHVPNGIDMALAKAVVELKTKNPALRVSHFASMNSEAKYYPGEKPWGVPCEIAFPCGTQNEIDLNDAKLLHGNGCKVVAEGANMPTMAEAVEYFKSNEIILCPAKAANAGGVAVSGLEMSQNAMRINWSRAEVDRKLQEIMISIFEQCHSTAKLYGNSQYDLVTGANIAGFVKVADSVIAQGYV